MAPIAEFGIVLSFVNYWYSLFLPGPLVEIGIWLFVAVVLFQQVTLPVEFNASSVTSWFQLEAGGFLAADEIDGSQRKFFVPAAMTYVAAVVMAILQVVLNGHCREVALIGNK